MDSETESTVLIVDDDPQFARTLFDILTANGYQTEAVATSQAALDKAKRHVPTVAVIDLRLEDASGLDLVREIKAVSPDTECILLTGYASRDSAIQAVNVGAYGYLQKPYDVEQLLLTIRRAAEKGEAERALRESEEKYRLVVESASEGIVLVDLNGTIQEVNPKALELSGFERQELVGRNFAKLLPKLELHGPTVLRAFRDIVVGKINGPQEWRMINKRGERVTFIAHYSLVKKNGKAVGLSTILEDITKRKRAEAELQESETKYRVLVEQSLQGMLVAQGMPPRLVFANSAMADILGYTVAELLSLSPQDTPTLVHPDDQTLFLERYQERLNGHSPPSRYELRWQRKDGATHWLEVFASRIDYHGSPAVQAVFVDITHRKHAEEQLRHSYETLQAALEGTITALATAVEKRDPYTAGHQRRVAGLAVAIAREMGLQEEQVSGIHMAGLIHDIGKIYVPADILSKPSKLTDIELMMIHGHPQAGYDVLRTVQFPWPLAEIVLQHHERMDGSGYPQGLLAEDIRLEARILAVADVVEAMASHRPYRPAHSVDQALAEISRYGGVLYDTDVVDACLRLFRQKGYSLDEV